MRDKQNYQWACKINLLSNMSILLHLLKVMMLWGIGVGLVVALFALLTAHASLAGGLLAIVIVMAAALGITLVGYAIYVVIRGGSFTVVYTLNEEELHEDFNARKEQKVLEDKGLNGLLNALGSRPGQMGWGYSDGADMSAYKYLVIKLKQAQNCDAHLNIFTENSIWTDGFESDGFGTKKQIVINLSTAKTKNGAVLNTKNIHIVAFWANGNGSIVVDDMYLTNNSDYSPEQTSGIIQPSVVTCSSQNVYTLSGTLVRRADTTSLSLDGLPAGIYIVNGKKLVIK